MGWLCCCPGLFWEPIRKRAHTQLVREHLVTVVSACRATVDWFWHKSGISVRKLISTLGKKKKVQAGNELLNSLPKILSRVKKATNVSKGDICLVLSVFFFLWLCVDRFLVRVSYLEIYNEEVRDLLSKDQNHRLEVRSKPQHCSKPPNQQSDKQCRWTSSHSSVEGLLSVEGFMHTTV